MRFEDLVFVHSVDGIKRSRTTFGNFTLSVIQEPKKNSYEAAIMDKDDNFVKLYGISTGHDDVMPYLSPNDVTGIMLKLQLLELAQYNA